jgi:hypothetical protein
MRWWGAMICSALARSSQACALRGCRRTLRQAWVAALTGVAVPFPECARSFERDGRFRDPIRRRTPLWSGAALASGTMARGPTPAGRVRRRPSPTRWAQVMADAARVGWVDLAMARGPWIPGRRDSIPSGPRPLTRRMYRDRANPGLEGGLGATSGFTSDKPWRLTVWDCSP